MPSHALIGLALVVCTFSLPRVCLSGTPTPGEVSVPDFGPNVLLFEPSTPDMQSRLDAVFAEHERAEFGSERIAILFKPGSYELDVRVGFYTHVAGLGLSPDDVVLKGGVRATAEWRNGNATCNFWRCAENLAVQPATPETPMVWAVSQATGLRRVHVKGNLNLSVDGWSSGGFIADSVIDGIVTSGSQQQWLSRNTQWSAWRGGNWNMVFVGVTNPPSGDWPEKPYTVIEKTPIRCEKPYLHIDREGRFGVVVPAIARDTIGVSWRSESRAEKSVSLDDFHIARADKDTAATINSALEAGKHLLLTPGIYRLDGSIRVRRAGTIVLGLGFPTLVAEKGIVPLVLDDVDDVRVSGILVEAGESESPALIRIGEPGDKARHGENPIVLSDIFCRVGGAANGVARTLVTINSSDVVGDNLWLWRADHGAGAKWESNRNANGLVVNGDDVTIYGLFVEHQQEYQTLWNGNGGRVYFYQSEMPYDPPRQEDWMSGTKRGYASYKVADTVTSHEAWGLGVYCVFNAGPIIADSAIEAPDAPGVKLHHMIAVRLNGKPGSGIGHVLNDRGDPVITTQTSRLK